MENIFEKIRKWKIKLEKEPFNKMKKKTKILECNTRKILTK